MTDFKSKSRLVDKHSGPKESDCTLSQGEKFTQAARESDSDEDEARWEDRLKRVVKVKPKPERPE